MHRIFFFVWVLIAPFLVRCSAQQVSVEKESIQLISNELYISGAQNTKAYLPLLQGKKIGVVANQTSVIGRTHLVDSLLTHGIDIVKIFTPEHGFRGTVDAGATVNHGKDEATGLPIISLYGKNKKPSSEMLRGIDLILFDLQDVGVRFYTYISTLTYVMEAAAENQLPVIVLDRPTPNGFYVDGPVLQPGNKSFIGLHQVPVVYGMTIGEYAKMVNGEGWLNNSLLCDLTVIPINNYNRNAIYELPVKPSPNLPTWESIYLYPTLCFFEGTIVSVGRGTDMPFQVFGHPSMRGGTCFIPQSKDGVSKPLLEGQRCRGENKTDFAHDFANNTNQIHLQWIIDSYQQLKDKKFFTNYFRLLSGNDTLQQQIESGLDENQIRASWQKELDAFQKIRQKYLMY